SSYVYSDLDFIFLGKIVETISGKRLDEYVYENFYHPLHMSRTGFNPTKNHSLSNIVPTEMDSFFRQQHIRGYVHDEAAAILGGVAGHAGLFSSAEDLGILFQMLLNGGIYKKKRYLKAETIQYFTSYQSLKSRRGLGFDKPEKNNSQLKVPYPALSGSEEMYGHTGFTGTCVWVEPRENLIFIFLTNRVNPTRNNGLLFTLNVRSALLESALKYSE
ncbi:MAG: serine hydrolase, partial [Sediminibacterium sp.]|nr:serine hydrolase [Sediminibacterium sp.]